MADVVDQRRERFAVLPRLRLPRALHVGQRRQGALGFRLLPVAPRKNLIVFMAFMASLALGVALSVAIELMDSGFRSAHQLEQQTGVAALGMVPWLATGRLRRGPKPWLTVVDKPNSAFSEALRTIRTGIALSSADHPQRTVVVTSSVAIAGVLLVFCYLIVPSVAAMLFADRIGARLAVGWSMGTVVSILGMYFSVIFDLPTGATIVCTFGLVLILMAIVKTLFWRK